jgi:hypothetical protein
MSVEATAGELPGNITNFQIMRRLLTYMTPFNAIMFSSLLARVIKIVAQAGVLGIAAASVGIYIESAEPGVVNWNVLWAQVKWIAIVGTIVGFASYIENYTGHYVAFRILAAFRDKFYYAMLPLAPARTAKLQSGDAVSRVMTDCERVEPSHSARRGGRGSDLAGDLHVRQQDRRQGLDGRADRSPRTVALRQRRTGADLRPEAALLHREDSPRQERLQHDL